MSTRGFRIRWLLALGTLGLLAGAGWVASRASQDAVLHRLWVEKELRMVALELARGVDGEALAQSGQGYELDPSGERLDELGGFACVEPLPPGLEARVDAQTWIEEVATEATGDAVVTSVVPVLGATGLPTGRLRVVAPAQPPKWKQGLRVGLMGLFVGSLLVLLLAGVNRALRSQGEGLAALTTGGPPATGAPRPSRGARQLATAATLEARSSREAPGARRKPVRLAPSNDPVQQTRSQPAPMERSLERRGTGQPAASTQVFSPRELVEEVTDNLETRVRSRGLQLCKRVEDRVPVQVRGLSDPVARALRALLQNAIQSTRQGSVLLRVSHESFGARLRYEVLDPGTGLGTREQDTLRRELERVRPADLDKTPPLTGPHLAQALLRPLGGVVEFDSHRGAGSRFWFTLPYEPEPALPSSAPASSTRSASTTSACFATS